MHILLVDDDTTSLQLVASWIEKLGHEVVTAENGEDGWAALNRNLFDLVISDWVMPGLSGPELCARVRAADFDHYIYFIVISARHRREEILEGLEGGGDDYITKPILFDELRIRLQMGERVLRLEKELREKYTTIRDNCYQTIHMFANLIEVFDEALGGHCRRTGELAHELACRCGSIKERELHRIKAAGSLHDIGFVGLPGDLLEKRRTEMGGDERRLYLTHPGRGAMILEEVEYLKPIAAIVQHHHEQFNGKGFPDGLAGEDIPLSTRIVSAASTYDNLVHRGRLPLEMIPENLQRQSGYQLDPALVDLLLDINLEAMHRENQRTYHQTTLKDLVPGQTLVRGVRMKTGAIVVPSGTRLTEKTIEKLSHYLEQGCIADMVYLEKWIT